MSSPNVSYVWVRYMAWLLSQSDTEGARRLAERALRVIDPREEGEKFNVWVAYLNLEAQYGGVEAAMTLFGKALPYCDPTRLHVAMLDILEGKEGEGGEEDAAAAAAAAAAADVSAAAMVEQLLKTMTKKFYDDPQVWLRLIRARLRKEDADGARQVQKKSKKKKKINKCT